MSLLERLSLLSLYDLGALFLLAISWLVLGWMIEHPGKRHPSVTLIMAGYRRDWMHELVTRDPRIFDATMLSSLRQGTAFFASGCMLAIGGVLAVVGNSQQLLVVAADLTLEEVPAFIWQLKLMVVVLFLTNGFLKFVWANRLFGYCAVMMAAVPNEIDHPMAYPRAAQAAEINIRAALNFNRGLRAIYFSLGTLAWLLGPLALLLATAFVTGLIWRREFSSHARSILQEPPTPNRDPAKPGSHDTRTP
ncbi:MAG: DUF599 domain-containing protein [Litoreibacter sp.]|nr:DUF599 domain-containing protein [Litoreibacter sp.]